MEKMEIAGKYFAELSHRLPVKQLTTSSDGKVFCAASLDRKSDVGGRSDGGNHIFELITDGVESFYLAIDGIYFYQEFEYDPIFQVERIKVYAAVAELALRGKFAQVRRATIFGWKSERRIITVGSEKFSFVMQRRPRYFAPLPGL